MTNALLLLAAWLVVYYLACQIWPYTTCSRCKGGKHRSPSGKAWRDCSRCGGSGKKRRLLARP